MDKVHVYDLIAHESEHRNQSLAVQCTHCQVSVPFSSLCHFGVLALQERVRTYSKQFFFILSIFIYVGLHVCVVCIIFAFIDYNL